MTEGKALDYIYVFIIHFQTGPLYHSNQITNKPNKKSSENYHFKINPPPPKKKTGFILEFIVLMWISYICVEIMLQAFRLSLEQTKTQKECKVIVWSKLDNIFLSYMYLGPQPYFSRTNFSICVT